ncbi:hypothetical protein Bpfe_013745 [Biomphalaria pfeifferi]|uniref:Uncharacterized protein n=1 Tax=Biomphalaria pfeifferi TaxID=112525 RepID=A0AAD8F9L3_BIOPF|nr:hypothetical protein Bpfe_013745 [Biomphalaria pfeifferi]
MNWLSWTKSSSDPTLPPLLYRPSYPSPARSIDTTVLSNVSRVQGLTNSSLMKLTDIRRISKRTLLSKIAAQMGFEGLKKLLGGGNGGEETWAGDRMFRGEF